MMKWISVKDRLPEVSDKPLLVWTRDFNCLNLAVFTGKENVGQWKIYPMYDIWYTTNSFVTHWMPLPEPPEKERCK
jgi:hypothetical protein